MGKIRKFFQFPQENSIVVIFIGDNFRQLAKISSHFPDEIFPNKVNLILPHPQHLFKITF